MKEEIINEEVAKMQIQKSMETKKNRLDELEADKWFELNGKLQTKKHKARDILKEKGVLEKKGENTYDNYKYFTEAQYKEIANELLVGAKLEIKGELLKMENYTGTGNMTVGRRATMAYQLHDIDTGFYEETVIEGEGLDRGDKAGYKAYTGAIKYFLANTFLIPTGDDPETESPEADGKTKGSAKKPKAKPTLATENQLKVLESNKDNETVVKALEYYKKEIKALTVAEASTIIKRLKEKEEEEK